MTKEGIKQIREILAQEHPQGAEFSIKWVVGGLLLVEVKEAFSEHVDPYGLVFDSDNHIHESPISQGTGVYI